MCVSIWFLSALGICLAVLSLLPVTAQRKVFKGPIFGPLVIDQQPPPTLLVVAYPVFPRLTPRGWPIRCRDLRCRVLCTILSVPTVWLR